MFIFALFKKAKGLIISYTPLKKPTVNQRVLGSSPRGGAKAESHSQEWLFFIRPRSSTDRIEVS